MWGGFLWFLFHYIATEMKRSLVFHSVVTYSFSEPSLSTFRNIEKFTLP